MSTTGNDSTGDGSATTPFKSIYKAIASAKVKLAPKIVFKNGKADKVWINLETIEGPADVKSTIWTAANLEDTIGIFHRPMIKSINKFLEKQCPKRYGPKAEAEAKDKKKPTKVAADKGKGAEKTPSEKAGAEKPAKATVAP